MSGWNITKRQYLAKWPNKDPAEAGQSDHHLGMGQAEDPN